MNNYNFLQRLLHRLALAPKFMREATFDAEDFFINATSNKEEHVFIAGLARSGTTILMNAIFKSENFASKEIEASEDVSDNVKSKAN